MFESYKKWREKRRMEFVIFSFLADPVNLIAICAPKISKGYGVTFDFAGYTVVYSFGRNQMLKPFYLTGVDYHDVTPQLYKGIQEAGGSDETSN